MLLFQKLYLFQPNLLNLKIEEFEKGTAKSQRIAGIRGARTEEVGSLIIEQRDLRKQQEEYRKSEELLEQQTVYIDCDTKDISFFMGELEKIGSITLQEQDIKI